MIWIAQVIRRIDQLKVLRVISVGRIVVVVVVIVVVEMMMVMMISVFRVWFCQKLHFRPIKGRPLIGVSKFVGSTNLEAKLLNHRTIIINELPEISRCLNRYKLLCGVLRLFRCDCSMHFGNN